MAATPLRHKVLKLCSGYARIVRMLPLSLSLSPYGALVARPREGGTRRPRRNLSPPVGRAPKLIASRRTLNREQARAGILLAEGSGTERQLGQSAWGRAAGEGVRTSFNLRNRCAQGWWHRRFEKGAHPRGSWRGRCVASVSTQFDQGGRSRPLLQFNEHVATNPRLVVCAIMRVCLPGAFAAISPPSQATA